MLSWTTSSFFLSKHLFARALNLNSDVIKRQKFYLDKADSIFETCYTFETHA